MMVNEKPGGHGERSVAVGTLDMAVWDAVAKIEQKPLFRLLAERHNREADPRVFVYAAGGYYYPGKDNSALRAEMRSYLDRGYNVVKMKIGGASSGTWAGVLDILRHLILPTLALGLFYAAIYTRVMRSSMLEVAQLDFVRTARAKGLSRNKVTIHHVLRNALLPVVTILGVQMGTVLAGSVVIESVFSWPGVGSLLFDSVSSRNYPVVLGIMVLGSLVVIAANIAVDLIYMWLDPRIEIR